MSDRGLEQMAKQQLQKALRSEVGEVKDLIPSPMLFPDEDPASFADLRDAMLRDLGPGTPYERALAENLVMHEWEMIRHRLMRDALLRAKVRDLAIGVFAKGKIEEAFFPEEEYKRLGLALVSMDQSRAAEALTALEIREIGVDEILAKAYSEIAGKVERHEKKLAELESRRRRLREEYDRLKAARANPIEDAEVIE